MTNQNDVVDGVNILTKREWYAGMALQGILAGEMPKAIAKANAEKDIAILVAQVAVASADALIAELNKDPRNG